MRLTRSKLWTCLLFMIPAQLILAAAAWTQQGTVQSFQKISNTSGNFNATMVNDDELGSAVANLGDLDGAGPSVRAIAVGAPLDDNGGVDKGAVYIMFLAANGTVLSYQKISNTQGNFLAPLIAGEEFGSSIASLGDLDGSGPSEVAIAVGAIGNNNGGTARGAVYILFLGADGKVLSYNTVSDTQGNFSYPLDNLDQFGDCVAALGDLNYGAPGVAALAVGATGDDDGGTDRGAIYILFLDDAGNVLSSQKISATAGSFTYPLVNGDGFGSAAAPLGDLDVVGPSSGVLAVGAPGVNDGGIDRGAVFALFLSPSGSVLSYQKISSIAGNFNTTLHDADEFGGALARLRDLDGPGPSVVALAVGAAGDDDGGTDRGAVYVLFLEAGAGVLSSQKISDTAGNFTATFHNGDAFGGSMAALGDLDGPGNSMETLVVGAPGIDDGGLDRGGVYATFLYGNAGTVGAPGPPGASAIFLGAARPNPFRHQTTIPFRIAEAARVRIDILDLNGRRVRTLAHEMTGPGDGELAWDGLDDKLHPLAPGAYSIRMFVNGRSVESARKMVLLR